MRAGMICNKDKVVKHIFTYKYINLHTKKTTKHARNATRRKQNKNSINIF